MEKLDQAAHAIADTQDQSIVERKKLAEETKSTTIVLFMCDILPASSRSDPICIYPRVE